MGKGGRVVCGVACGGCCQLNRRRYVSCCTTVSAQHHPACAHPVTTPCASPRGLHLEPTCLPTLPVCPPLPTHASLTRRDVKERCQGVAPGSARVIACLQEHREQLSPQCASRLFQHEVRLAEDIGERAGPFRRSCLFNQGLGCVQPKELWHEDAGESGMPLLVAAALSPNPPATCSPATDPPSSSLPPHMHTDFKYPLRQACVVEIELLCRDVPHGHARVVRCLQVGAREPSCCSRCIGCAAPGWGVGGAPQASSSLHAAACAMAARCLTPSGRSPPFTPYSPATTALAAGQH